MAEHDTGSPWNLPYPDLDEPADVPADIQQLAEAVASKLSVILADFVAPIGSMILWPALIPPAHYLTCDGTSYVRAGAGFEALFAAIGTTFGSADGAHFNVPDMRGRVAVGQDGAAGRLAANDVLGNSAGAETHALSKTEVPEGIAWSNADVFDGQVASGTSFHAPRIVNATGSWDNINSNSPGTAEPHSSMQPYLIVNYVIRFQ
jgi:microcystin-dependent protein